MRLSDPKVGAVVSFVDTVRDLNDGASVQAMELEHYPGMTEKALAQIVADARTRWSIVDALVIHRVGPLLPLEQIVLVAVTSADRCIAFAACEFIMDYLKTQAPFWKKEQTPDGARWVDARERRSGFVEMVWTSKKFAHRYRGVSADCDVHQCRHHDYCPSAFHHTGRSDVVYLDVAYHLLDPIKGGSMAAILFGIGLFAAG